MSRPKSHIYFFNRCKDAEGFEHVSTDGALTLDCIVGETLAAAFCDCDNGLELVRMHRQLETIVVHKRLTDIKATLTVYV